MTGRRIAAALLASRCCAFVGFDGFVDRLMRVVRERRADHRVFFPTMEEFGGHVAVAAGRAADLEVVVQQQRMGGNAPLMASALARLGVRVTCAAAMGLPDIHDVFRVLQQSGVRCETCGNPGLAHAYEFNDGKLMLAEMGPLEEVGWQRVKESFGLDRLAGWIGSAGLLACVNWGVMPLAGEIWKGLLDEVILLLPARGLAFFDIADPIKRSSRDLVELLGMLSGFKVKFSVEIGLNENEARQAHRAFGGSGSEGIEATAKDLFEWIQPDTLVVHPLNGAVAVAQGEIVSVKGRVVEHPKLTTGGGDHFNGGWCAARLAGLGLRDSLSAAIASSGHYVSTGAAAAPQDIGEYIARHMA